MGRHQIRDKILLFSSLFGDPVKPPGKAQVSFNMRLSHGIQHRRRAMLRRHLQLAADMMPDQFLEKLLVFVLD